MLLKPQVIMPDVTLELRHNILLKPLEFAGDTIVKLEVDAGINTGFVH